MLLRSSLILILSLALPCVSWSQSANNESGLEAESSTSRIPSGADDSESPIDPGESNTAADSLLNPYLTPYAYGEEPGGIAYSSAFRHTGAPFAQNDPTIKSPFHIQPFRGSSITGGQKAGPLYSRTALGIPHFRASFPLLRRGAEPNDADLKLGPVYLNVTSIGSSFLFTDNKNRNQKRDADAIAIATMGVVLKIQFTDTLQYTSYNQLAWLPLEGTAGWNGLGYSAGYLYGLDYGPFARGQLTFDVNIGGWEVTFADDYSFTTGQLSDSYNQTEGLFDGAIFNEEDRAGRYTFRPRVNYRRADRDEEYERDLNTDIIYFTNVVSAQTQKMLPADIRFRAGVSHQDIAYFNRDEDTADFPRAIDRLSVSAASERVTQRFKPYASYRVSRYNYSNNLNHVFGAGVTGPITDQLFLTAGFGWFFSTGDRNKNSFLWNIGLEHIAGPYTRQALFWGRSYNDFNDRLVTRASYYLNQVIARQLTADFFVDKEWNENLDEDFTSEIFRVGLRFNHIISPKTTLTWSNVYSLSEDSENRETWGFTSAFGMGHQLGYKTALRLSAEYRYRDRSSPSGDSYTSNGYLTRAEISHFFTDSLTGRLSYQFSARDASNGKYDYYENLIFLNVTKHFP